MKTTIPAQQYHHDGMIKDGGGKSRRKREKEQRMRESQRHTAAMQWVFG
jgi:hypothetical protein